MCSVLGGRMTIIRVDYRTCVSLLLGFAFSIVIALKQEAVATKVGKLKTNYKKNLLLLID